jgi:predicted ATPase/DNA-binding SARP family transcriptional activator
MASDPAGALRIGVLGALEVSREGRSIAVGGERQRTLLAVLVLRANELVATGELLDLLFGERRQRGAASALRVAVSRLRRDLHASGEPPVLETRPGGYVLQLGTDQFDLALFERVAGEGRALIAAGEVAGGSGRLREALGLWRGSPLADLAHIDGLQGDIRRLEQLRLAALVDRVDADLALGAGAQLIAELEALVAAEPFQERVHAQLMLALYRSGQHAQALEVYRRFSAQLRDQLGLEPGTALRDLERSILVHDPALGPQPFAISLTASRLSDEGAAGGLPVASTPFIGRAQELAELAALLRGSQPRLVTLTGPGGSGKTRLALALAASLAGRYRDGARFVSLAELTERDLIADETCQALAVTRPPSVPARQRLASFVADRELLLILDNLEQLLPVTDQITQLLAAGPGLTLLVTSREPLALVGEQQYEVPVLQPSDAADLFIARARASAPRVEIDPSVADAICERLDRLPLAIELAAARIKALVPAELLGRLDGALPLLTGGPHDAPRRQRTLRAAIDWSYQLLDEPQQRLLARLAVFSGGCTLAAAEAVCDADLDTLGALVDRSLVQLTDGRYRMLETLREYALERLAESGERDRLRRALTDWLLELLADVTPPDHEYPDVSRLVP